jgi:hypothetical protein
MVLISVAIVIGVLYLTDTRLTQKRYEEEVMRRLESLCR